MNGKFKFGLESLLKYRRSIEDQYKIELSNLIDEQARQESKLDDIRDAQIEAQRKLQKDHIKAKAYMAYMDELSRQSAFQKKLIKEVKARVSEKKEQILKATIDKKIIEKLKNKKYEQYKQNVLKAENKILDEIATNRFSRKDQ